MNPKMRLKDRANTATLAQPRGPDSACRHHGMRREMGACQRTQQQLPVAILEERIADLTRPGSAGAGCY